MATRTISNTGGVWSNPSTWVEGIAPTASDSVIATATSGNVSINSATNACGSLNLTGYTGTMTFASGKILNVGNSTLGDFILGTGMTLVLTGLDTINLISTKSTANISTNGIQLVGLTINSAASACNYSLQSDLLLSDTLTLTAGKLTGNGHNVTATNVIQINGGSLFMGTGIWTTSNFQNAAAVTANTSTLVLTGSNVTLLSGNLLHAITVNSPFLDIQDALQFNNTMTINGPCLVQIDVSNSGAINLFGSTANLVLNASQANPISFISDISGAQWSISAIGGKTFNYSWIGLTDSLSDYPNNTWNAINAIDGGNNSGWNITAPAAGGGGIGQGSLMLMGCGS